MKLRYPDQVRKRLIDQFGLTDQEAVLLINIVEREYGFVEPPGDEPIPVTLRLLATIEFLKEALSDFDEAERPQASLH
jgi:hypothetical protein